MNQDNLPILYRIEKCLIQCYQAHPEITDHVVRRVYEAAASHYRAVASGREADRPTLDGVEASIYDTLFAACEDLRTRGAGEIGSTGPEPGSEPVPAITLNQCMNKLVRSVEKGTKRGGVRGYLQMIVAYVK